jgi:photosystem II stability/assembly factor-like uncharacterized protein
MTPLTNRLFRSATLLVFVLLASTAASTAATARWVNVTPFGGAIQALAQAPSAPATVYAVAGGRVFRSVNDGATWRLRPGEGELRSTILELVVDPFDPQTLYARTGFPGLERSRDGGLHWSEIGPELANVQALAADPEHPGVLFAGTQSGLYRSDDGGETWVLAALEGLLIEAVAIDPRDTATIVAAIRPNAGSDPFQVWRSTDRGATWTMIPVLGNGSFAPGQPRFVFDPARPGTLYLFFFRDFGGDAPLLRSTDSGASWTDLGVLMLDLAASPAGVLYAGTELGISRSTDAGTTWVPPLPLSQPAPPRDSITRILASPTGTLLAGGSAGLWRSGDGGESWQSSNQGLRAQGAWSVAVTLTGPPTVYTLAGPSVFRSADRGATWTRVHSFLDGPQPYAIAAIDPRRPRTLYGFATDGQAAFPLKSANGGQDWVRRPFPYTCAGQGSACDVSLATLVLDPHDSDTVLVAGRYFYRFQGQGDFLLRSDDGLVTWDELATPPRVGALAIDPARRGIYYALTCSGLSQSQNAGASWQKTGRGLPRSFCPAGELPPTALAIDPHDSRRIYVGTTDRGVFVSFDGGTTFRAMNRGLETARVATLLIDPADTTRIYAGAPGLGVFRWNASRARWIPLRKGLPLPGFDGAMALDHRTSALYAASSIWGLFRFDLDDEE